MMGRDQLYTATSGPPISTIFLKVAIGAAAANIRFVRSADLREYPHPGWKMRVSNRLAPPYNTDSNNARVLASVMVTGLPPVEGSFKASRTSTSRFASFTPRSVSVFGIAKLALN